MRILITGPECSGKSTLAKALSNKLDIPTLSEYARTYLENNGSSYTQEDLLIIAQTHHELYLSYTLKQPLILDTYLLNIKIWSEVKYGQCHPWIIEQLKDLEDMDLILLLEPDLPWVQDGLREAEDSRYELFEVYKKELEPLGLAYEVISGAGSDRVLGALEVLRSAGF